MTGANWLKVGSIDDIPMRGARVVKSPFGCVAIFRTATDEVFAIDDKCPHKGGPLSQGIVHGQSVTCPLHNWVINLATGEAQGADSGRVRTIPVELVDGVVMLRLGAMIDAKDDAHCVAAPTTGARQAGA